MQVRYEEGKLAREEPWKFRQVLDQRLIKRTEAAIKALQEKQPKRIFLLTSLGEKCGRVKNENSVRALIPQLQNHLAEAQIPIQYMPFSQVQHVAQNGSEDLKEGIVYIVENLNFRPDEHSFVEPWVEADADKPKEEEKKEAAAPVDPKKMTPAEKKKYEEELKRKAEEEANKPVKSEAELEKEAKARQAKEEAAK